MRGSRQGVGDAGYLYGAVAASRAGSSDSPIGIENARGSLSLGCLWPLSFMGAMPTLNLEARLQCLGGEDGLKRKGSLFFLGGFY